jgi:hypothetical protein
VLASVEQIGVEKRLQLPFVCMFSHSSRRSAVVDAFQRLEQMDLQLTPAPVIIPRAIHPSITLHFGDNSTERLGVVSNSDLITWKSQAYQLPEQLADLLRQFLE